MHVYLSIRETHKKQFDVYVQMCGVHNQVCTSITRISIRTGNSQRGRNTSISNYKQLYNPKKKCLYDEEIRMCILLWGWRLLHP